jgi:hypothetical protein
MYEIEKNIPIPTKGHGSQNKATTMREVLLKMVKGDSFKIKNEDYHVFGNAKKFLTESGCFIARKLPEGGFRIFRIR